MKKLIYQFGLFISLFANNTIAGTIELAADIKLQQLNETTWVHTSLKNLPEYGVVPSNGLIKILNKEALLVDTAWNNQQTNEILDWLKSQHILVKTIIITHSHDDRMGGLKAIHQRGIRSIASKKTIELATQQGKEVPNMSFEKQHTINFQNEEIELYYPGPGHTLDNIVVWFKKEHLLFGGCLIKNLSAKNLGNTQDAAVDEWKKSISNLEKKYTDIHVVIPGHGAYANRSLLQHTIGLLSSIKTAP